MGKPFDVSKFRKDITKSIDGLSIGFNDPTDWISTGNYALNYLISGDFARGIPLGKVTVFAGDSGAGHAETVIGVQGFKSLRVQSKTARSRDDCGRFFCCYHWISRWKAWIGWQKLMLV